MGIVIQEEKGKLWIALVLTEVHYHQCDNVHRSWECDAHFSVETMAPCKEPVKSALQKYLSLEEMLGFPLDICFDFFLFIFTLEIYYLGS